MRSGFECQCGGGEAAKQLSGVGECMQRCQDAAILAPEIRCGYGELRVYTPATSLQAVVSWKQRKHLAQLPTGSHWLAAAQWRRVSTADDVEHKTFDCGGRAAEASVFVCT